MIVGQNAVREEHGVSPRIRRTENASCKILICDTRQSLAGLAANNSSGAETETGTNSAYSIVISRIDRTFRIYKHDHVVQRMCVADSLLPPARATATIQIRNVLHMPGYGPIENEWSSWIYQEQGE